MSQRRTFWKTELQFLKQWIGEFPYTANRVDRLTFSLSANEDPNDGDEFKEQNDGTEQEQRNSEESECQRNICLSVAHGCVHDTCKYRQRVEQSSNHKDTYDDENRATNYHPDTGKSCLTDSFGVVEKIHALLVCPLEVSRNFLKH